MDKAKRSIPKAELRKIMKRFLRDSQRGISIELFAQLAGLSASIIKSVFVYETEPLTEYVQRRVSKAYTEWKNGEVSIMQNRDQTRFVQYRKDAVAAANVRPRTQHPATVGNDQLVVGAAVAQIQI